MMPVTFPEHNKVFGKPADMTDEQCMDLPVWQGQRLIGIDKEGNQVYVPIIISHWKFSKEDLETIRETGGIWLEITGLGMPPVELYTETPFNNG